MISYRVSRREFAGGVSAVVAAGLAGCGGFGGGGDGNGTPTENGTAAATGTPTDDPASRGIQVAVLEDDATGGRSEAAWLRVFHGSPDAPEIDVVVAGESEPIVSGLAYGESSDYAPIGSGSRTLGIRPAGADRAVAEFTAEFQAGRGHTAYAVGYLESDDPGAETAFDLVGVVDGTAEAAAGQGETGNASSAGDESSMGNDSATNESAPENDSAAGTENETSTA